MGVPVGPAALPDKGFWLVYDFGGGTFDAAVIKVEDGEFTVVNHAGDNSLGGKRIDWALVDDVLIPARARRAPGEHRHPGQPEDSKGPCQAEAACRELRRSSCRCTRRWRSRRTSRSRASSVELTHTLTRDDLNRAARELVEASIRHCRKALSDARLSPQDINRVLLVGGTSQMALVREMLTEDLGIPVDHSQDPITVVARGAALYAGTRRAPADPRGPQPVDPGTVRLNLDHPAAGLDDDPLVGGRAESAEVSDWTGWTIELRNVTMERTMGSAWSSGQVELAGDGTFRTRLQALGVAVHEIAVTLRDRFGNKTPTDHPTFTYNHRSTMGDGAARAIRTIGVGLADNTVQVLVARNDELPRTGRAPDLRTSTAISKTAGGVVSIPILEGDHARADRNTVVGRLDLRPEDVSRDVPEGSEVEVELTLDTSFQVQGASAYLPLLDEEFPIHVDPSRPLLPSVAELQDRRATLAGRYDKLREQAAELGATAADARLDQFDTDGFAGELDRLLHQAAVDQDAVATCNDRLLEADSALDEAEETPGPAQARPGGTADSGDGRGSRSGLRGTRASGRAREDQGRARDRHRRRRQGSDRTAHGRGVVDRAPGDPDRRPGSDGVLSYESQLAGDPRPDVVRLLAEGRSAIAAGDLRRLESVNARLRKYAPTPSVAPPTRAPSGSAGSGVVNGRSIR